jgi:hypothetical protein
LKATALAIALALSLPTLAPDPPVTTDGVVSEHGDQIILAFDEEGVPVSEFLEASGLILGVPVVYEPQTLNGLSLNVAGAITCARADFRTLVDRLLLEHQIVTWDAEDGAHTMHARLLSSNRSMSGQNVRLPGQVFELGAAPAENTATYTAIVMLEHVDARSTMASLHPFVDTQWEGLRNIERSNALIITALSTDRVERVAEVAQLIDQPPVGGLPTLDRMEAIEQRLAELEQQLAAKTEEG